MPLREQWSAVEKAIMAEEVLQDVPIREEDNIWDYLDGPSRFEMEELRARRAIRCTEGGEWIHASWIYKTPYKAEKRDFCGPKFT
ncbi:hypothetical protein ACFX2J_022100 [Malus domestica]